MLAHAGWLSSERHAMIVDGVISCAAKSLNLLATVTCNLLGERPTKKLHFVYYVNNWHFWI